MLFSRLVIWSVICQFRIFTFFRSFRALRTLDAVVCQCPTDMRQTPCQWQKERDKAMISESICCVLNLFGQRRFRYIDVDRSEVGHAEVLPVESFCEVVDVVNEKPTTVDDDGFADSEVDWREILFHFLVRDLHGRQREVGFNVVTVLWTAVSTHEHWKRILSVVVEAHLDQLHRVVAEIVLDSHTHTHTHTAAAARAGGERFTALTRWLQLRFDFDSTAVRLLIKGHQGHSDVSRYPQLR